MPVSMSIEVMSLMSWVTSNFLWVGGVSCWMSSHGGSRDLGWLSYLAVCTGTLGVDNTFGDTFMVKMGD